MNEQDIKGRTVAESTVETYHIVRPADLNAADRLYGGVLMEWIDEVAVVVARKHAQMAVTTGSVDNLKFLRGAYLKDTIVITGKPTHVGNCSMEIKVETYVQHIDGEKELINRAFLTLVGLDENDRPARLPRLILETDEDRAEWERAEIRRNLRKQQQEDGFSFYGD
ncbi:MAG: hotdog domain-containing protein [Eubacteriales bacterium]|nr:hotdog domain-containing protein [Eubacteriales bacterium]